MTNTTTPAHTYGVTHLSFGWHRWAFTCDGVALVVYRYRRNAEQAVELANEFRDLMGHDLHLIGYSLDHYARNGYPTGLHTAEDEAAWLAGAR